MCLLFWRPLECLSNRIIHNIFKIKTGMAERVLVFSRKEKYRGMDIMIIEIKRIALTDEQ